LYCEKIPPALKRIVFLLSLDLFFVTLLLHQGKRK